MKTYESPNGYKGLLYGESSLKVLDYTGKEVFHTKGTTIKTTSELKEFVDGFPTMRKSLLKLYQELSQK